MARVSRYDRLIKDSKKRIHCINNCLTPISGILGLIEMQACQPAMKQNIEVMKASVRQTIQELKDWQHSLATGSPISSYLKKHTKSELKDYLLQFPILARPEGIEYTPGQFDINTPGEDIWIDLDFIRDTTMNMIINSQEARATRIVNDYYSDADYLLISFKDNGEGMDEDAVRNCLRGGFTTKKDGHGIGLSSINEYMRRLGGYVEVRSQKSQGAEFILAKPLRTLLNPPEENHSPAQ